MVKKLKNWRILRNMEKMISKILLTRLRGYVQFKVLLELVQGNITILLFKCYQMTTKTLLYDNRKTSKN